jgi:GDP-L-fucose synthase
MKQKLLITGASGFIGKNLAQQLKNSYTLLCPNSKQLNLLDSDHVSNYILSQKVELVVHSATHSATITSDKPKTEVFYNNVRMFMNLASLNTKYRRMVYFGSVAEYHKELVPPNVDETYFGTHIPETQYGFSKYMMAEYCSDNKNVIDLRIFGCFGPHEDYRIRFISNSIVRVLCGKDIHIKQNRVMDYLYVGDLGNIIDLFLQKDHLIYPHYNVCTGKGVLLSDIAKLILKYMNSKNKIVIEEKQKGRDLTGNNLRLMGVGNIHFTPLDRAIKTMIAWYTARKDELILREEKI